MAVDNLARRNRPMNHRTLLAVSRALVHRVLAAAGVLQRVQVEALSDEVMDGVERLQDYGFASRPHPGAEGVVLSVGGARNHPVLLAVDDRRYRPALDDGEAMAFDDQGQKVHLARGGIVIEGPARIDVDAGDEVTVTAATKIILIAPDVEVWDGAGNLVMQLSGGTAKVSASTQVDVEAPAVNLTASDKVKIAAPVVEIAAGTKVGFT